VDGEDAVIGQIPRGLNQALIFSNNCPVGRTEGYFVCHIWMMFASGCAFQNLTTNWIRPVYDLNASADVHPNLRRKAQWELIDGPGSLPKKVSYYGYSNYVDETNMNNNTLAATYTATGVTNAGTIKIPSGFVFEWEKHAFGYVAPYGSVPRQPAPTDHLRKQAVGIVTAVRPYCSRKDLTPTAIGQTMVIDLRPWQEPGSTMSATILKYYVTRDGVEWLPFAKAQKAYVVQGASPTPAATKPAAPTPAQPKPVSRGIVAIILLLPLAVISLFVWLNKKKE
jgi:hypothetical protein